MKIFLSKAAALIAAVVSLSIMSCANPTAVNATRQLNRDAERSGSPYRWRVTADGHSIEKYRIDANVHD